VLATYAGTNGRPFGSVGLALLRAGVFKPGELTHTRLHDYLRKNPDAVSWILARNPRYTFFQLTALPEGGEPPGATGQALVPARAVAADPSVVPLGALLYFSTLCPQADHDGRLLGRFPTSRYAFALDTGGAIQGPGRIDIYAGHGPQAETTARYQWDAGTLYVLVKKLPDRAR
jgi:membrane-bound lytic murein transglycosylase A